jgi:hypothetical protein
MQTPDAKDHAEKWGYIREIREDCKNILSISDKIIEAGLNTERTERVRDILAHCGKLVREILKDAKEEKNDCKEQDRPDPTPEKKRRVRFEEAEQGITDPRPLTGKEYQEQCEIMEAGRKLLEEKRIANDKVNLKKVLDANKLLSVDVPPDGNCMIVAVVFALKRNGIHHTGGEVRHMVADHFEVNRYNKAGVSLELFLDQGDQCYRFDKYGNYIPKCFEIWIKKFRSMKGRVVWGNQLVLMALVQIFGYRIRVWQSERSGAGVYYNDFNPIGLISKGTLTIAHQYENHYVCVVKNHAPFGVN